MLKSPEDGPQKQGFICMFPRNFLEDNDYEWYEQSVRYETRRTVAPVPDPNIFRQCDFGLITYHLWDLGSPSKNNSQDFSEQQEK